MRRLTLIAVLAIAGLAAAASAQPISVTVDGDPVAFSGAGPQTMDGRVLVPLRGVLEKMGAYVDWVAATRTVVAQKGDTDVELGLGQRYARVNGRMVALDVPALSIAGRTMVPLRFLGEALGAGVTWDAPTRTVVISTSGETATPEPPISVNGPLSITSFTHDAGEWLQAGNTLTARLRGTPGATASFQIPGVVQSVAMREGSAGQYAGSWTVPANSKLTIAGATVLGMLRHGGDERLIQASDTVSVDTVSPTIKEVLPERNTQVATGEPSISAVFEDQGSGIDPDSIVLMIDGVNATSAATTTSVFVNFKPEDELAPGSHTVAVTAADVAGNKVSEAWKFTVTNIKNVITSFTTNADESMEPGDVITVRMEAQPKGKAVFNIGKDIRNRSMAETSSGVYEGEYTIRRSDNLAGALVSATFTTAGGQTYNVQAGETVDLAAGSLEPPVITQPKAGASVSSPLVVGGTAPPNSRVGVRVEYQTNVFGAVPVAGVLAEVTADVDKNGAFKTGSIDLSTLIQGKDTVYTITAATLNSKGEQSEPATVTVKKS